MLHKLALFGLLLVAPFRPETTTHMIDRVTGSVVRITGQKTRQDRFGEPVTGTYVCTGFVIGPNTVLTAAHCAGDGMLADGVLVSKVQKRDEVADLEVLLVASTKPALHLRTAALDRFEAVYAVGYGEGFTQVIVNRARVQLPQYTMIEDGVKYLWVVVAPSYIHGQSGGPLVDGHGLVVGVIQRGSEGLGFGVGSSQIAAFLAGLPQ